MYIYIYICHPYILWRRKVWNCLHLKPNSPNPETAWLLKSQLLWLPVLGSPTLSTYHPCEKVNPWSQGFWTSFRQLHHPATSSRPFRHSRLRELRGGLGGRSWTLKPTPQAPLQPQPGQVQVGEIQDVSARCRFVLFGCGPNSKPPKLSEHLGPNSQLLISSDNIQWYNNIVI